MKTRLVWLKLTVQIYFEFSRLSERPVDLPSLSGGQGDFEPLEQVDVGLLLEHVLGHDLVVVDAALHLPLFLLVLVDPELGQLGRLVVFVGEAVQQFPVKCQPADILMDVRVQLGTQH